MKSRKSLRLGTRKSLLAVSQSKWIANEIIKTNPNISIELREIETKGDQVLDIPLWKMEGKDFFVAELDRALLRQEVDITVHSLKDLSLDRPNEIVTFVSKREMPNDIVVFAPGIRQKLEGGGQPLRIGTSSPRRTALILPFLKQCLPNVGSGNGLRIQMVPTRGNVITRLGFLHSSQLEGVVLALAGLSRLWESNQDIMSNSLKNTSWMILPLRECPTTPGQGALAIECLRSATEVHPLLEGLMNKKDAEKIEKERNILRQWGGGCHQVLGATAFEHTELGEVLSVRGVRQTGEELKLLTWSNSKNTVPLDSSQKVRPWDGAHWRNKKKETYSDGVMFSKESFSQAVFIAHSRAVKNVPSELLKHAHLWTSGVESWIRLAKLGFWIEGCAEGLGFDHLGSVLKTKVLGLPHPREWDILTHIGAEKFWKSEMVMASEMEKKSGEKPSPNESWENPRILETYKVELGLETSEPLQKDITEVKQATHLFWRSFSQWELLGHFVTPNARHACGPGKTARFLRAKGMKVDVFPSVVEWRNWIADGRTN